MKPPHSRPHKTSTASGGRNAVRIIAGRWRGRRIAFPDSAGLRPTPDRVRETVFNWLQPVLSGARCLDLFAGSGALGFEALSRGASEAVLVEREPRICAQLEATATALEAATARIVRSDATEWLASAPAQPFDVVFLDPPYASGDVLEKVCRVLDTRGWLGRDARVYLETPADAPLTFLPAAWVVARTKRAGQVGYHLARVAAPAVAAP